MKIFGFLKVSRKFIDVEVHEVEEETERTLMNERVC
jgi:hypothetical protein